MTHQDERTYPPSGLADPQGTWFTRPEGHLCLWVPLKAPSLNQLKNMHRHAYKDTRDDWQWMVEAALPRIDLPLTPCSVVYERRYARAQHQMDIDNLYASAKIPLDALQRAGVLEDDAPDLVTSLTAMQSEVKTETQEGTLLIVDPIISD